MVLFFIYIYGRLPVRRTTSLYTCVCICVYTKSAKRLADLFDVWGGRETAMFHDRSSLKSPLTHRQAYVCAQSMWPSRHISAGKWGGVSTLCKPKMFQRVSRDAIKTISRVRKKLTENKSFVYIYIGDGEWRWYTLGTILHFFSINFCLTLSLESCPLNENPQVSKYTIELAMRRSRRCRIWILSDNQIPK
jgi:hypothetical protein